MDAQRDRWTHRQTEYYGDLYTLMSDLIEIGPAVVEICVAQYKTDISGSFFCLAHGQPIYGSMCILTCHCTTDHPDASKLAQ